MKFLPGGKAPPRILDFDLTPMVDVVFLLNIFFMTTTQFAKLTRAEIDLPVERGEERRNAFAPKGVVINVDAQGAIVIDERPVDLDAAMRMVAAELRKVGGDEAALDLTIRADRAAPAAAINRIATGLIKQGVRSWKLATESPAPGVAP